MKFDEKTAYKKFKNETRENAVSCTCDNNGTTLVSSCPRHSFEAGFESGAEAALKQFNAPLKRDLIAKMMFEFYDETGTLIRWERVERKKIREFYLTKADKLLNVLKEEIEK